MSIAVQVALVMVVLLVVMLAAGVPIGVGIGLSSAISMICMLPANVAFATSAQRIFAGSNSFSLIAIPFFILLCGGIFRAHLDSQNRSVSLKCFLQNLCCFR